MGKEYTLSVPFASREVVASVIAEHLQPLLSRIDPNACEPFPNVYVSQTPDGLYLCDNLTDPAVAALVMREAIELLLWRSPSVTISEP
jgi:hypothetical protein